MDLFWKEQILDELIQQIWIHNYRLGKYSSMHNIQWERSANKALLQWMNKWYALLGGECNGYILVLDWNIIRMQGKIVDVDARLQSLLHI